MRIIYKKLTFLLLMVIFSFSVFSQENDCAFKLREAQNQFDMGQIENVPDLLKDCIESGFTREDRIQALKLLINSYLFDDNLALAEQYMLAFMKKYPEYEVVTTDPSEFVSLLEEFNNDPRSSIGVGGGLNFSNVRVIQAFGPDANTGKGEGLNGPGEYKTSGFGFQAGIVYNINLGSGFELSLEPMVIKNIYKYEYRPFDFAQVVYNENQLRVDFPVSLIWTYISQKKIDPYFRAGFKTSYLVSTKSDAKRSYLNTGTLNFEDVTGPEEEIMEKRLVNNYWAVFGAGIRYKIPRAYIFLDLRYNLGLVNQVNSNSRNNGLDENYWLYYYLQDDFYIDNFAVSIGVAKTIFNPKRK